MPKILPVGDRLLLTMKEAPDEVKGLAIPDEAREIPQQATIIAIGDTCARPWQVGEHIIVGRHSGSTITLNYYDKATWVRIIRENEILARVED